MENEFLKKSMEASENRSETGNGALSYRSIGTELRDQFSKAGSYVGRPIDEVWKDQEKLWEEDQRSALVFPFYLRAISRETDTHTDGGMESVTGCGVRDEAFKRLLWIEDKHPESFYMNLWLLPYLGSWKDLVTLYVYNDDIDAIFLYGNIMHGLDVDPGLVWKYMPRIVSSGKIRTEEQRKKVEFAKGFCKMIKISHRDYRKMKSAGEAHKFQRDLCSGNYGDIDWSGIPGIALNKMAASKIFDNHPELMDSYRVWLQGRDSIRFNGFPFELSKSIRKRGDAISKLTADAQFKYLIDNARKNGGMPDGNIICALDTSGSMECSYSGPLGDTVPGDIANALAIYFSELTEGAFHNCVINFDNTSTMSRLSGTFSEKYGQIMKKRSMGSTNFQSIVELICKIRRENPEIPLGDYPTTLLVVSDMQFNPSSRGNVDTNLEASRRKLREEFPDEWARDFRFIWWNCCGRDTGESPADGNDTNSLFLSGFDGSIVTSITKIEQEKKESGPVKKKVTYDELIYNALHQPVFEFIR